MMIKATKTVLALAAAATLAACGGGEDATQQAQADAQPTRMRALAAQAITNDQLFQWAQLTYPELFGSTPPGVIANFAFQGQLFDVRDYGNGNYLGVSNGRAYGYGNFTGLQLVDFGAVQGFGDMVCARINCGGGGTPVGALNGCTEPASTALRTGNRYNATYVNNVLVAPTSSGEYQVEGEVLGSASFEGQSTVKARARVSGMQYGQSVNTEVFSFMQAAGDELIRTLGTESAGNYSGYAMTTHSVWNPAILNSEFTLAPGASITKTESMTSSMVITGLPVQMPPTTTTTSTTHTYEGRETITVLGRSFNTCRYRSTTADSPGVTYTWYIVDRGFAARIEGRSATGVVESRSELKSGSINGSAL